MISSPEAPRNELLATFARNVREQLAREVQGEHARAEELRARVAPLLDAALVAARAEGMCGRAWLFGSFAWGSPGERSDVDLLVEGAHDPDLLAAVLARACGREMHVVRRETAPASLVARATGQGRAL